MFKKPFKETEGPFHVLPEAPDAQPLERLRLFSLKGIQMRTFHITWLMFFVCFFGWFGLAPLMPAIRADLGLSKDQVANIVIASVASTVLARLIVGWLCDRWGPRKTAIRLLLIGSVPVFLVGLSHDYLTFLLFRFCIGIIGASFVVTQFHTSLMVSASIKGTANAITGGWGNLGGGVTNMVMPLVFAAIVGCGYTPHYAWRYAMIFPGLLMLAMAFLYYRYTADTPQGNFKQIRSSGRRRAKPCWAVLTDIRLWALAAAYAVCFGMELTFDNVAALHFVDTFHLKLSTAGFWAGTFGFMNLFARALGGYFSDKTGRRYGLKGKGLFLAGALLLEGLGLELFAGAGTFVQAIGCMFFFAFFLKMANGGTFGIVPFLNEKNIGLASGIVGACGNLGGVAFGFLFKSSALDYAGAFHYIGYIVIVVALLVAVTRFNPKPQEVTAGLSVA